MTTCAPAAQTPTPVPAPAPRVLDVLGANGAFAASARVDVAAVDGTVLARLGLAPRLYLTRTLAALRRAAPLGRAECAAALERAAALFLGEVDGVSLAEHEREVALACGVALPVVRAASRHLARGVAAAAGSVAGARPGATGEDWRAVTAAGAVWTRRGEVLAVQAPANHPAVHAAWVEALALGYRVAVRPSAREPFTPYRLVRALRDAGLGPERVALLPTEHALADELVRAADLALVYGGEQVERAHGGRRDVLVQGPGRSAVLLDRTPTDADLRTVVDSLVGFGATACVNASTLFVAGDARTAEDVARRVDALLAAIPTRAPLAEDAVLPVVDTARAHALEAYLHTRLDGARLVTAAPLVDPLPTGGAVLRPAVVALARASAPQAHTELPFPALWVAPWSPGDGLAPLRGRLTVTALTDDEQLVDALVAEPTVANVHLGHVPTHAMAPALPHDGYLSEFLMRSKAVIRTTETPGVQ